MITLTLSFFVQGPFWILNFKMNSSDNELRIKTCQSSCQLCAGWPQNVVKVEGLIDEGNTICLLTIMYSKHEYFNKTIVYLKSFYLQLCFENCKHWTKQFLYLQSIFLESCFHNFKTLIKLYFYSKCVYFQSNNLCIYNLYVKNHVLKTLKL